MACECNSDSDVPRSALTTLLDITTTRKAIEEAEEIRRKVEELNRRVRDAEMSLENLKMDMFTERMTTTFWVSREKVSKWEKRLHDIRWKLMGIL